MGKTFLCFSTFQPDSDMSAENRAGPSYGNNPSPLFVDTTLVYNAPSPVNEEPSVPASAAPSLNTTSRQRSTPSSQAVKVDGLQVSGKASSSATYQRRLEQSSCSHGQMAHGNKINCTSSSGLTFVVNDRLIPTIHL